MAARRNPAQNNVTNGKKEDQLTFETTSLHPFLRQFVPLESSSRGGGERQFNHEIKEARDFVNSINQILRDPNSIHDLVHDTTSSRTPLYPTRRMKGVSEGEVRKSRFKLMVLLMLHATNDGEDGGVTSGGIWLPPRQPALDAQDSARAAGQPVRYPQWTRESATNYMPPSNANWTSSGLPPRPIPPPVPEGRMGAPGPFGGHAPPQQAYRDYNRLPYTGTAGHHDPPATYGYGPTCPPGTGQYPTFSGIRSEFVRPPPPRDRWAPRWGAAPPPSGYQGPRSRGPPPQEDDNEVPSYMIDGLQLRDNHPSITAPQPQLPYGAYQYRSFEERHQEVPPPPRPFGGGHAPPAFGTESMTSPGRLSTSTGIGHAMPEHHTRGSGRGSSGHVTSGRTPDNGRGGIDLGEEYEGQGW